jgi:hypothetical protein
VQSFEAFFMSPSPSSIMAAAVETILKARGKPVKKRR